MAIDLQVRAALLEVVRARGGAGVLDGQRFQPFRVVPERLTGDELRVLAARDLPPQVLDPLADLFVPPARLEDLELECLEPRLAVGQARGLLDLERLQPLQLFDDGTLAPGERRQLGAAHVDVESGLLGFVLAPAARLADLPLQRAHVLLHLGDDVFHAAQIAGGRLQLPLGRLAPVLVAGNPGRLLEHRAPLLGLVGEDAVDHALLDQRIRVGADPGTHEQVLDVLEPTNMLVETVLAHVVAEHAPSDGDFGVFERERSVLVGEPQDDLGEVDRLAVPAAGEDHLVHLAAAYERRALFPEHPADRVGDVALAAPVGPHDRRDPRIEVDRHAIGERLEPVHLETLEFHAGFLRRLGSGIER